MYRSSDLNRVGTRRILACPDCRRLQYLLPRPVRCDVVCKNCHRVFRVTEAGEVQATGRRLDPAIIPWRTDNRFFYDRLGTSGEPPHESTAPQSSGDRWSAVRQGFQSAVIVSFTITAAVSTVLALVAIAEFKYPSVGRAGPEENATTIESRADEPAPGPRVDRDALRGQDPGRALHAPR